MKIKINNQFYNFFDNITINYKLDSVASLFSFDARFNPDNAAHRLIFQPLTYNKVEIFDNNDNLKFTGTSINTSLGSNSKRDLQNISGYSKGGILEDCTIPYSAYPLENLNVSLKDISTRLLKEFGLNFIIDSSVMNEMNQTYPKAVAGPEETVKEFISKLAAQRNIILSHDAKGNIVFFKPNANAKAKIYFSAENTTSMNLSVNGQSMHSTISVIRQPSKDNPSLTPVDTINNHLLKTNRTVVKVLSSGSETDTQKAANNALADELKSIVVDIEINRYEDLNCGDIVEVHNHEIFLFHKIRLMISEIVITETVSEQKMSLKLMLPETFTGDEPKNIFYDFQHNQRKHH
jgi:prophage tail gpP-like protein